MSTAAEQRLAAYLQAESDIIAGKRVSKIQVDGETVEFTDTSLIQIRNGIAEARSAVKAEQLARRKNKVQYWGYGGRE
mgnify:CR=1 FL=1